MADKSLNRDTSRLDDTIWDHKWGFADTRLVVNTDDMTVEMTGSRYNLCGFRMPYLIPFAEEALGLKLDFSEVRPQPATRYVSPVNRNEPFCSAVASAFANDQVSFDDRVRLLHSHGQTTVDEVSKVLFDRIERSVDMVFSPESHDDCVKLIELAGIHDVCLIPYGGGTNVTNALQVPPHETRMVVAVDMRRMDKIEWIDKVNFRACVQAGITGKRLEEALEKEGFTCGHEPDSVELSTLGGWIATNASGMKKNRYGNIEDIVENSTLVTPAGVVEELAPVPRVSMGMQLQRSLFGSEGNLGLITRAVIKIRKLPEVKSYGSIVFPNFKLGVDFLYALSQTGVLPASIRLVDNIQFRFGQALKARPVGSAALMDKVQRFFVLNVKKLDPHKMCAATLVMEGTADEVAHQEKVIFGLSKQFQGLSGGPANGQRGYMLTYAIAYIRDLLADYYVIGETYETTVPWSNIHEVCAAVERVVYEEHQAYGMPGKPYASPRITQVYHTGVCIYFTHGFSHKGVDHAEEKFAAMEKKIRQAIMDAGGSISHHHGVGKLRKEFMVRTMSPATTNMLKELKQSIDPKNVFGAANNIFAE
jgi:alkyldihydroxyacetonephosphate synthase